MKADFITSLTVNVTPQPGGSFLYDYQLAVGAASDLPGSALSVSVDPNANLQNITAQSGWDILYSLGTNLISWESLASTFDIQPGNSATFSFVSPLAAGSSNYAVVGFNDATFEFGENDGTISAPSAATAAPEPASCILALLGLPALVFMKAAQRRAKLSSKDFAGMCW